MVAPRIRLPPLRSLEAFAAAGRHLSFTGAAAELDLTVSAVSHRIAALERHLGVKLFKRFNRALELTEPGRAYLARVQPAFDLLGQGTAELAGRRRNRRIRLSVTPAFATAWLVPRLSDFYVRYPGIEVELDTTERYVDFDRDEADAAIRFGRGSWPGLARDPLFDLLAFPVANPRLAKQVTDTGGPSALARQTLLHGRPLPGAWSEWLGRAGLAGLKGRRNLHFPNMPLLYEAAASGLGCAIGIDVLVQPYLASGRLVAPFALVLPLKERCYFVAPRHRLRLAPIASFRRWLLATAAAHRSLRLNFLQAK